jgi:hypothetical protein
MCVSEPLTNNGLFQVVTEECVSEPLANNVLCRLLVMETCVGEPLVFSGLFWLSVVMSQYQRTARNMSSQNFLVLFTFCGVK